MRHALLVDGSPQIVQFAADFYENLIYKEGVTIASMLSFQSSSIESATLNTPETDRFTANGDASFSEQIFNEWSGTPAVAVTTRLRLKR